MTEATKDSGSSSEISSSSFLSNNMYDRLKWIAQIFLPALATLYFALSQIWGLPKGAEVVGTITALDTFLGLLLGLATKAYDNSGAKFDGTLDITEGPDVKTFSLSLNDSPESLEGKDEVTFKVNQQ